MPDGLYLYCIGHADQLTDEQAKSISAHPPDGSEAPFRTVSSGDLAALVSETEVEQFTIERDRLMAHHEVLLEAMKLGDILPVSYGIVASNEEDIVDVLLTGSAEQLKANLAHVNGRVELSLRVMWNQEVLFEEIVNEYDEIRQLRDAIAGLSEEQSYYERIQLGELTSGAVAQKTESERESILRPLREIAIDDYLNPGTSEALLFNASFLVDRNRESEFDETVQEIGRAREGRMTFRYLGPLPPASFVSVAVEASE